MSRRQGGLNGNLFILRRHRCIDAVNPPSSSRRHRRVYSLSPRRPRVRYILFCPVAPSSPTFTILYYSSLNSGSPDGVYTVPRASDRSNIIIYSYCPQDAQYANGQFVRGEKQNSVAIDKIYRIVINISNISTASTHTRVIFTVFYISFGRSTFHVRALEVFNYSQLDRFYEQEY